MSTTFHIIEEKTLLSCAKRESTCYCIGDSYRKKINVHCFHKFLTAISDLSHSRKIWRGIKFGGLAVCLATAKLKSASISHLHKLYTYGDPLPNCQIYKSANIFATEIWGSTAKFNISGYTVLILSLSIKKAMSSN